MYCIEFRFLFSLPLSLSSRFHLLFFFIFSKYSRRESMLWKIFARHCVPSGDVVAAHWSRNNKLITNFSVMTRQYPRVAIFFSGALASPPSPLPPPRPPSSTLTVFVASTLSAFLVPTSRKGIPILNKSFLTAATSLCFLSLLHPSPRRFRLPLSPRLPHLSLSLSFFSATLLPSRSTRLNVSVTFVSRTVDATRRRILGSR